MKKVIISVLLSISFLCGCSVNAGEFEWKNDLHTKFLNNEAVIMEINIRSFNSKDLNGDGFIQEEQGEERGTFVNAVERLDELKNLGINTLHILPITPVGKLKALGTAGSLYSASDFKSLNPDLFDKNSDLGFEQQAKLFIDEAHKRGIRVIIDVPACASYDLFLQRPDLFVLTPSGEPVLPSDWTDVRLLSTGTEDKLDVNTYSLYKDFVKFVIGLGADGIRADVAHSKTALFWKELIKYSRKKDPEFLWLAESSELWHDAISPYAVFTPYDKLLDAGFDGFYGAFSNIKNWEKASDLYTDINSSLNAVKKIKDKKSVIGAFATHDDVSPILLKGIPLSDMIIWLNATLPVNSYFVDGFQTGDTYLYPNGNKTAESTNTDDDIYFTHRGQIDIFNLSRKPEGESVYLKNDFILANNVKQNLLSDLNNGTFIPIKIKNEKVFAYTIANGKKRIIVIGNLNFKGNEKAQIHIPKYSKKKDTVIPIKISNMPSIRGGKIYADLSAGEIIVLIVKSI